MKHVDYDIIVCGGSLGGVMAAYAAAKANKKVLLTEATAWLGGQLTNQGVPSDEHRWIEEFGCTKTYREYRNKVRRYYNNHPFIIDELKHKKIFNPGTGWVSEIAHEPKLALHLLNELLLPFITNQSLTIMTHTHPVSVLANDGTVEQITFKNTDTDQLMTYSAHYMLDATDTGDLLPLSKALYVTGSEGSIYGEPHASKDPMPDDMQPITWVAAISYHEGQSHPMEKPKMYDHFRSIKMHFAKDVDLLSWYGPKLDFVDGKRLYKFLGTYKDGDTIPPLFSYRQIVNKNHFKPGYDVADVTLINWPQNDYVFGNVFDCEDAKHHLEMAKQLTLSLIYWLKTEAQRDDGGIGYPEIKLRGDVLGTKDGLALAPYIRESRRMLTEYIVKEQDISAKTNTSLPHFWDSVGVGSYHIDLHMTTVSKSYFFENTWPFEIPLGALISKNMKNLIPACKNIGTTHITNGCFRLHPVEWNIGEVAGHLAAYCLDHKLTPKALYANKDLVKQFQTFLVKEGIEIAWPEEKVTAI